MDDLDLVKGRITELEHKLARSNRVLRSLTLGLTVFLVLFSGTSNYGDIVARSLTIVDKNGEPVINLSAHHAGGGGISVLDKRGKPTVQIGVPASGGIVVESDGRRRGLLGQTETGGILEVCDKLGQPVLILETDPAGQTQGRVTVYRAADRKVVWRAP